VVKPLPKKPGEFKAQQHAHKRQQAVYDAIKKCRETGEAFVTFQGERLKLAPVGEDYPEFALVKARGRVRLAHLVHKDGLTATFLLRPEALGERFESWEGGGSVRFPHENVLCAAVRPTSEGP
jgi:hypothetical protein